MDRKLIHDSKDIATKFNNAFSNTAAMVEAENWYDWCWYIIISRVDPSDKPFDTFFAANGIGAVNPFVAFDEPEYHYLVGNMNVLFGDGSVMTKEQDWLSKNRSFFGQLTVE
jgi:prepilin-type processing-associated H-X9-DG protein